MMRIERHPQVDADVDEALAYTFREFGAEQVPLEVLVHSDFDVLPPDLVAVEIDIPASIKISDRPPL